jgi:hypothetical protein
MKKRSYVTRLGVLALALTFLTTCLVGGTLAKYTTTVAGTGSATVAKWSFKANNQTETFTVDLASTAYTNVANKKIAPGTQGSFAIEIDASGSEVAVDYSIAFSDIENKPENLKFYSDDEFKSEITDFTSYTGLNDTIALEDVSSAVTKTIYWNWDYGAVAEESKAAQDTKDGESAKTMTFTITVTGIQATPETSASGV